MITKYDYHDPSFIVLLSHFTQILQQKSFKAAVFLLGQDLSLGPGFDMYVAQFATNSIIDSTKKSNLRDVEAALGTVTATSERPDSLGTTVVEPTGLAAISAILVRLSSRRHTNTRLETITTYVQHCSSTGHVHNLTWRSNQSRDPSVPHSIHYRSHCHDGNSVLVQSCSTTTTVPLSRRH